MIYKYKVSIIIPTYNRSGLLKLSLESLSLQTLPKNYFEVIVVDDGSTDDTKAIVERFSVKINIKYLHQENKGYRVAAARNKGILNSEGEICVLLDCGILVASNAIEEHINSHSSNSNQAVLGYIYDFDEYNENEQYLIELNIDPALTDSYFSKLEDLNLLDLRESTFKKLGDDLSLWPAPWAIFYTGYLSIRKETIMKVGLFDESFTSWGFEDIDYGLLMFVNNVQIVLNRNLKSIHVPHEKSRAVIGEEVIKNTKKILHKKYNLKETEIYINVVNGRLLNEILSDFNR